MLALFLRYFIAAPEDPRPGKLGTGVRRGRSSEGAAEREEVDGERNALEGQKEGGRCFC